MNTFFFLNHELVHSKIEKADLGYSIIVGKIAMNGMSVYKKL